MDEPKVLIKVEVDGRLQSTSPLNPDCVFVLARAGNTLRYCGNATPYDSDPIDHRGAALIFQTDRADAEREKEADLA